MAKDKFAELQELEPAQHLIEMRREMAAVEKKYFDQPAFYSFAEEDADWWYHSRLKAAVEELEGK